MSSAVRRSRRLFICLLCLAVMSTAVLLLAGCSNGSSGTTGSTATTATAANGGTTSTSGPGLTQWQKELAITAQVANKLTAVLEAAKAGENDPRRGLLTALRARTLAISTRQALADKDYKLADQSMLQVYQTLNMTKGVATGAVADTIAKARAIINTVGAPSDAPDKAAPLIEQFITATATLLDEAAAEIPSTTTTLPSTTPASPAPSNT